MKHLLFDPVGGASGDMILGSLIDLGCPAEHVREILDGLGLGPCGLRSDRRTVCGLSCVDAGFSCTEDRAYRTFADIRHLLEQAPLEPRVRTLALRMFTLLVRAESNVHGVPVDEVHFHEVGARDSIFDLVGIAAAVIYLDPESCATRPVPLGCGMGRSQHGPIPLPAPATVELLKGLPVKPTEISAELTTPTGAVVLKTLCSAVPPRGETILVAAGCGCGDRVLDERPNLFRALFLESSATDEPVWSVCCDVDDMISEDWEAAREHIVAAGALDVTLTPRTMKQGRPGVGLAVLVEQSRRLEVERVILTHTSTIGVRSWPVERLVCARRAREVATPWGPVRCKEVTLPDGSLRIKPEYRELARIAAEHYLPMHTVRSAAEAALAGEGNG